MNDWKEYRLGELVETNKKSINSNYPYDIIEYLDTGSITSGTIDCFQKYNLEEAPSRARRLVAQDDIIYSTVRPIQRHYGFIDNPVSNLVVSTGFVTITCKKNKLNPKFLYYILTSDETVEYLDVIAEASTSAYPSLRPVDIENLKIIIPGFTLQKTIATILSSLDDKIALLHHQNATLEKMAETLFRQRFIEDAKEDWKVVKVRDLINILSGFAFKSSYFDESGQYSLITIKAVQDGYLELNNADKIEVLPNNMPNYCKLQIGDILLSLTGNVGRCCLVDTTDLLLNQRVAKLQPNKERDRAFTYFLFRQPLIKQQLEEMGKGTAQSNLSPIETSNIELIIPDEEIFNSFSDSANPWLDKLLFNKKSIQTLTSLRDTLLPKLMNGEVTIVE